MDRASHFNRIRRDLRRRPPTADEILQGLFIGEYPRTEDVAWLRRELSITAVLSLQDDDDLAIKGLALSELLEAYRTHQCEFRRVPIIDNDLRSIEFALPEAIESLHALIVEGHTVLLHCNAGYNRAPTVAIAYLHQHRSMTLAVARDFVRARRPCVPFMTVLESYFGSPSR